MARPMNGTTPARRNSKTSKPLPTFAPSNSSPRQRRTTAANVGGHLNLSAAARETKRKIKWDRILRGSPSSQWTWLENVRNFSLYTRQGSSGSGASNGYGVLATGMVCASVQEVASLLAATSQTRFEQKMAALHAGEFKHGTYVSDIAEAAERDERDSEWPTHLSVRSVTFARRRWLQRDDEWHYLESTEYDHESQRFEKLLTTLTPEDIMASPLERAFKFNDAKRFRDIVAGYCVQAENTTPNDNTVGVPRPAVRVHFYAELEASSSRKSSHSIGRFVRSATKHEASTKAMKQRLVSIAKDCDRLEQLVRRRRLGMQVLIDQRRVQLPPTNITCLNCLRTQLVAKLCRICGLGVCGECSDKYERETHRLRRGDNTQTRVVRLERIRVCDPCLQRVESADYSLMSDAGLNGAFVFPDAPRERSASRPSATEDLKQLLHDALLEAPSTQRKGAVMNVIRCVLNQESEHSPVATPLRRRVASAPGFSTPMLEQPALLTPQSSDRDYAEALNNLEVETTPYKAVETADMAGRGYAVDPKSDLTRPMPFPVTETETQRLTEIEKLGVLSGDMNAELNIICDIAAKEMDAFATIVTMITADSQHVVAANVAALEHMVMKREDAFCQHAIMSDKPLIVPHPEADVRFSRIMPVTDMGIKYYCGFPITSGADNTVIGTLCCVDQKKHDITESQYNAMQKLALTAAKVVKIQGERRRNSSVSSVPSYPSVSVSSKTEL